MDSTAQITDDQELAKVLESMNQQATSGVPPIPTDDVSTQADTVGAPVDNQTPAVETPAFEQPVASPEATTPPAPAEVPSVPELTPVDTPYSPASAPASSDTSTVSASPELEAIKKDALEELRPLVDKLNLPADEKFDTLLLIIRSTDDQSLLNAAHDTARAIEDETKRAQALLDVIKEIDYFSGHGQQPA